MSLFQFFTAMQKYSLTLLFLAFIACILTSFVKKHIFHNKLKKLITFVPFVIGFIINCLYIFIYDKNTNFFSPESFNVAFQIGGVSTIYYIFYEQFIRNKKITTFNIGEMTTQGLLQEIVEKTFLEEVSKNVYEKVVRNINDENLAYALVTDTIQGKLKVGVTNTEILATAKIIVATLKSMN